MYVCTTETSYLSILKRLRTKYTQWEFYLPSEHVSKIGLDIVSPHCPGPEARHHRGQCHAQGSYGGLRSRGEL